MKNFLIECDDVTGKLKSKVIQGKYPKDAVKRLFPQNEITEVREDEFFLANFIIKEVDIDHNLPRPKRFVHTCYYKVKK